MNRKVYGLLVVALLILASCAKKTEEKFADASKIEYDQLFNESSTAEVSRKILATTIGSLFKIKDQYKDSLPIFPFSNSNVAIFSSYPKDAKGIPMLSYDDENYYYPITYTRAALSNYQNFIETKDPQAKENFLTIVQYIEEHVKDIKDFSVLTTSVLVHDYQLKGDWTSAMGQGFAIGVMIQAYHMTQEEKYLKLSQRMVRSFDYPIEEGGVQANWDGYPFYEEYADPNSHVLNGFIFSLGGLYYSYKVTGNEEARLLFEQGINSLKARINRYDASFTSNYSKVTHNGIDKFASAIGNDPDHYHELVIYQLLTLYNWTKEEVLKEYAHKFLKYDTGNVTEYYDQNKYKAIEASHSIDSEAFGVNHLNDELWSWGNYWSTNKVGTTLTFEFWRETKDIEGIVFYAISEDTLPTDYEVYVYDQGKWVKVCHSSEIHKKHTNYYKTDNYETFIVTNYFPTSVKGTKVKLVFNSLGSTGLITLRECNLLFDRSHELEMIERNTDRYLIQR
ncbi:D-glucuronyl C5-epimerase family protein [Myroides sp. DW712]|uniref:D-glucuronyl C5-epimerase family protein n=1 Tax=Myroides sp. DW712 TaxID=3389800 RepID=UPI00397CD1B3